MHSKKILPTLFLIGLFPFSIFSQSTTTNCNCDYVMDEQYINPNKGSVIFDASGVLPGDTICFLSSILYRHVQISNLSGTEAQPIIITNCGGQVQLESITSSGYGMRFIASEYFHLTGSGSQDTYGFKISTQKGVFVDLGNFSRHFEVDHIEVDGTFGPGSISTYDSLLYNVNGFVGISVKTSPYVNLEDQGLDGCVIFQDSTKTAWVLEGASIHDNYIHHTAGEAIYAGHGFFEGRAESRCDEDQFTYPHNIYHMEVYNNIIDSTGWDGVQIKNAVLDVEVYNNIVTNYGVLNRGAHNEGFLITSGTTGDFHHNTVINGTGVGMWVSRQGNSVYNNLIVGAGDEGIRSDPGVQENHPAVGVPYSIFNNTIVNSGTQGSESNKGDGIAIYGSSPEEKRVYNNLVVGAYRHLYYQASTDVFAHGNILIDSLDSAGFVDVGLNDYHLTLTSNAVNAGISYDTVPFDLVDDRDYQLREDGAIDVGAFEFQNALPVANAGADELVQDSFTTLDASLSYDDIGIFSYQWSLVAGDSIQIEYADSVVTPVTGLNEGFYKFGLTITDLLGRVAYDTLEIEVQLGGNWLEMYSQSVSGKRIYMSYDNDQSNANQQDVGYPGNHTLTFSIKKDSSAVFNWDKLEVGLVVKYQQRSRSILDFISAVDEDWVQVTIPVDSLFHDPSKWAQGGVSKFYLLARSGFGTGSFGIDEVSFNGSSAPFLWYGNDYEISGEVASVDETSSTQFRIQNRHTSGGSNLTWSGTERLAIVLSPKETTLTTDIYIYPNPVGQYLSIKTESTVLSVAIFDFSGKKVKTFYQANNLDVKELPAGLYFAEIVTDENQKRRLKLIKE